MSSNAYGFYNVYGFEPEVRAKNLAYSVVRGLQQLVSSEGTYPNWCEEHVYVNVSEDPWCLLNTPNLHVAMNFESIEFTIPELLLLQMPTELLFDLVMTRAALSFKDLCAECNEDDRPIIIDGEQLEIYTKLGLLTTTFLYDSLYRMYDNRMRLLDIHTPGTSIYGVRTRCDGERWLVG